MKIRPARSFERAIQQIIATIGEEAAATAVDRSESLVRKWSDPDNNAIPSIKQALALDEAFVSMTQQPAPVHAVYLHRLSRVTKELTDDAETVVTALFNLHASIGDMTRLIAEILEDKEVSKLTLTPRKREVLLAELEKVALETSDLEKAVQNHGPQTSGST